LCVAALRATLPIVRSYDARAKRQDGIDQPYEIEIKPRCESAKTLRDRNELAVSARLTALVADAVHGHVSVKV
jgi:hypothetical protein